MASLSPREMSLRPVRLAARVAFEVAGVQASRQEIARSSLRTVCSVLQRQYPSTLWVWEDGQYLPYYLGRPIPLIFVPPARGHAPKFAVGDAKTAQLAREMAV